MSFKGTISAVVFAAMLGITQSAPATPTPAPVDLGPLLKRGEFNAIKLSPTGEFYAATVPLENKTALVVIRRADRKVIAQFALGRDTHISRFTWVNPTRLLVGMAEKMGFLDQPQGTGELFAVDTDGSVPKILVGSRGGVAEYATRIAQNGSEQVAAFLIDDLPGDDQHVLISVQPFVRDAFTRVEKMDVYSGRRTPVTRAPVARASFTTDNRGQVRFATGAGKDNVSKLFHRADSDAEWVLINDEGTTDREEFPVGFASDNRTAYLRSENAQGTDSIIAYDTGSGERKPLLRDERFDPNYMLGSLDGTNVAIGALYMGGKPRSAFFDENSVDARLHRKLEKAFPGQTVWISSATADGQLAIVEVSSPSNPGDFYLFDQKTQDAAHLLSRRQWLDPDLMASVRPIELKARDGLALNGFLTIPAGSNGQGLPMVVMPHGGPFGIFDAASFDDDAQLLAKAGYAVLQVNYRGSGNHGRAFLHAGARQWGGTMQDDVTDATKWAVEQKFADPSRICIYGASYGAYAALMGVAKEPGLFRCAAGYVGVYDLELRHGQLGRSGGSSQTFADEWMGDRKALGAISPTSLAGNIKVPVFLAAGGEDTVTPIAQTRRMEAALRKASVPVETMYALTEGHGFYTDANRKEFYTRLLAFLSTHLGGSKAK